MANNVEKCINLLQAAKTDNEQFAGLLLVAKVIKAEECDGDTLQRVFDAIGFPFLTRLLRSSHVPEGCGPNVYRKLAVTVLSCFFQRPQLCMDVTQELTGYLTYQVSDPKVVSCMPYFNDIITEKATAEKGATTAVKPGEEPDQLVPDCYDCLSCIAAQSGGRAMLIKEQCVSALAVAVHKQCPCWERAEAVLLHLVSESGSKTWHGNEHGLHVLLFALTQRFKEDQSEKKFELCTTLGIVLSNMEKEQLTGEVSVWTSALYKGLTDILKSKLGSTQRNPALILASAAVDLLGVSWTLSADGHVGVEGQNCQCLLLLVHLTCIEVRMTLEDKNLTQVAEIGDLLVGCYRLLENIIAHLATGPSLALDARKVGQLHSAMVGAFNAVIFFLHQVELNHPDQGQSQLVMASLRVLGSWVAEETTALQKEVQELLPFILSVCSTNLECRRQVLTPIGDDESKKTDMADTESGLPHLPSRPTTTAVPEVVRFLLPGLCHLSADEGARKVLMNSGGPELLVNYFDYQWTFFMSPGNTEDCKMALTTLCGVMLNLVVLEGPLMAESDAGKAFLRCALVGLPAIEHREKDLVLALNLAVLGFMMLRHYKSEEQGRCEAFCKSAIHLLSAAHCRKRMGGDVSWTLQVSEMYAPHWEDCIDLWVLAMQALAIDLSLYSWLPRPVLGSGFIPIILRLLMDVKDVDRDAVGAYQGVLVAMAKNDKTAKQLLREQQAQQLARTHKMEDLGRALAR